MEMLERAGAESSKPEGLGEHFGLIDGKYHLTERQAQAILDLRLHKLTGLEQDKIISEYRDILDKIEDFLDILNRDERLRQEIRRELEEIREESRAHMTEKVGVFRTEVGLTEAIEALKAGTSTIASTLTP